jgi:hypothetical protein
VRTVHRPLALAILVLLGAPGCGNRGFPGDFRDRYRGGDETGSGDETGGGDETGTSGDVHGVSSAATTGASTGSGAPSSDAAQACVDRINEYRSSLGLPAYARWSREESCADDQAASDSQSGAAHGAFTQCGEWAQNECPGWPGPAAGMILDCLEAMWGEGPGGGHYENMSSSEYTSVACGFHDTGSGDVWAVQDFK